MMRSESTSALGQPSETNPTLGACAATASGREEACIEVEHPWKNRCRSYAIQPARASEDEVSEAKFKQSQAAPARRRIVHSRVAKISCRKAGTMALTKRYGCITIPA
jgi:hypothetical protein